jgi:tripeptidyl-peptidase-1
MELYRHGDYARVTGTAACVSEWLGVKLHRFVQHRRRQHSVIRTSDDSVMTMPSHLSGCVAAIHGLTELLPLATTTPFAPKQAIGVGAQPGMEVTPPVLAQRYGLTEQGGKSARNSQAVAAFEDAEFVQSDVDFFSSLYKLPATKWGVVGPNEGGYYGEATLDTQYLPASGRGVKSLFVSHEQFDMLAWSLEVLNVSSPPQVLSVSWGSGESGFEAGHMKAASAEFQKMAGLGITIVTASGDAGTGKQGLFSCKAFDLTWPASSPWVTSVGGTSATDASAAELGWPSSGGGFSSVFPRPSYQNERVAAYLANATLPSKHLFDSSGRSVPDVALLATNYRTYRSGWGDLSGTSAATPIFAGMLSVINDGLLSAGKPTLGFVNPTLYAGQGPSPIGFDVTSGNNKASGCPAGFTAEVGYDAVTGLGSPSFQTLKALLVADQIGTFN